MPSKELYNTRKQLKRCVHCGKTDAFTLNGRIRCAECTEKHQKNSREKYYNGGKEKDSKRHKELYEERKSKHICVQCGKYLSNNYKYILCEICRAKKRKSNEKSRRKKGVLPSDMRGNGVYCYICCKPVETLGKKLCNSCYEKVIKNLEKAQEHMPKENYFRKNIRAFWNERSVNRNEQIH